MVAAVAEDHGLLVAAAAAVEARLIQRLALLQLPRHLLQTLREGGKEKNNKREREKKMSIELSR